MGLMHRIGRHNAAKMFEDDNEHDNIAPGCECQQELRI